MHEGIGQGWRYKLGSWSSHGTGCREENRLEVWPWSPLKLEARKKSTQRGGRQTRNMWQSESHTKTIFIEEGSNQLYQVLRQNNVNWGSVIRFGSMEGPGDLDRRSFRGVGVLEGEGRKGSRETQGKGSGNSSKATDVALPHSWELEHLNKVSLRTWGLHYRSRHKIKYNYIIRFIKHNSLIYGSGTPAKMTPTISM